MNNGEFVQIITFLTVLSGFGVQLYRESRNRQWDFEDRQRLALEAAQKLEDTAAALRTETVQTAADLKAATKMESDAAVERLAEKIAEGTEHAASAYVAANNVNLKIEDVNKRLLEQAASMSKVEAEALLNSAKRELDTQTEMLSEKIEVGTKHAADAYKEANSVNLKIEDLNKRLLEQAKGNTP